MTIKGQHLFEVQGYLFLLKIVMIKVKMKNTYFLHLKLTKICSSTKIMRIMPIICSQLPLGNNSYTILNAFLKSHFYQMESRQVTGKIAESLDYPLFATCHAALVL